MESLSLRAQIPDWNETAEYCRALHVCPIRAHGTSRALARECFVVPATFLLVHKLLRSPAINDRAARLLETWPIAMIGNAARS